MTWICLLRGINVSGQKRILMADLRALFEAQGFRQVSTYIQSGNVRFDADQSDPRALEALIARAITDRYGFDVVVFVLSRAEVQAAYDASPFRDLELHDKDNVYFSFLSAVPDPALVQALLAAMTTPDETPHFAGASFSLFIRKGYNEALFSNLALEKRLKVRATTRNRATVRALLGEGPL